MWQWYRYLWPQTGKLTYNSQSCTGITASACNISGYFIDYSNTEMAKQLEDLYIKILWKWIKKIILKVLLGNVYLYAQHYNINYCKWVKDSKQREYQMPQNNSFSCFILLKRHRCLNFFECFGRLVNYCITQAPFSVENNHWLQWCLPNLD